MGVHFKFATIHGIFVAYLLEETCESLNRDAMLGDSGPNGANAVANSESLVKWLCACWDLESHSTTDSMVLEQYKVAGSKQMGNFTIICKIIKIPFGLNNGACHKHH